MSSDLAGLSSESIAALEAYAQWSRQQRERMTADATFEARTYSDGRLLGHTYTRAEVTDLLQGQLGIVLANADKASAVGATATAELCRAVLREADRFQVPLKINAAEVLQKATLSSSGGSAAAGGAGGSSSALNRGRGLAPLAPVGGAGGAGDATRLAEAQAEIARLREKMAAVTRQLNEVMSGKSASTEQLLNMRDALSTVQSVAEANAAAAAASAKAPITVVETKVETREVSSKADQAAIAALRSEVNNLNKEMASKLNQSTQFLNMKKMLTDKNTQVRALRERLSRFDPSFVAGGDDDDLVEEDD